MTITCDVTTGTAYDAAISAADYGAKAAAGLASVRTSIGADFRVRCWHDVPAGADTTLAASGDNLVFEAYHRDALIFQADFSGLIPLVGTALEIEGPAPDVVVEADSAFTTNGVCRIESLDGTRHIQGSFGLTGTDFTCSGAMVAADGTDVGLIRLAFNAIIDDEPQTPPPGSGNPGGAPVPIDTVLDWMAGESTQPAFGTHRNAHAYCAFPGNHAMVVEACNWQGQERTKFDEYYDCTDAWVWVYYGPGNSASGKRVQMRNLRYSLLRASINQWEEFDPINHFGDGQMYIGVQTTLDLGMGQMTDHMRREPDGTSVALTSANMGCEMWADGFSLVNDRAKMADSKAWAATCQLRVINEDGTPYTGADAKYVVQLGWDIFFSGTNSAPGTAGEYGKHGANSTGQQGYPRFMADAGSSRWVPFTGADGWFDIGHISYDQTRETVHGLNAQPPWGNYDSPYWAYSRAPYALTEAEIRDNHPAWMT